MPSRVHRVALVSSSFAPHVGGVETHVARVASELTGAGHAVEVWTVDRGLRPEDGVHADYTIRYLPTPLPARNAGSLARFASRAPRAWHSWRGAHRDFAPTVLHVHCFGPNGVYGSMLSKVSGTPLVVTSHGETRADDDNVFDQSALLRTRLKAALAAAVAVTAPSEFVLTDLRRRYGLHGGSVIPNGVDPLSSQRTHSSPHRRRYILGVGRLGSNKGFDLLLRGFAMADLPDDMVLRIVGDGPEHANLARLAAELGVEHRVEFTGRADPTEVADHISGAAAVIVPSRVEAFGIVALETWRGGAPLVMTERGGAPEFVRDGVDGILVDPTHSGDLARAIERVIGDRTLAERIAVAGSKRWRNFGWERVAEQYVDLYDRID